jgi:hypothetical protein
MMKTSLNLLPLEHRVRETARRRFVHWCLVWAVCAAAAVGVWWLKHGRCLALRQRLQVAQRDYAPLEKLLGETETMRSELDGLHAKGTILGRLLDDKPVLTLFGAVSQSAQRCNGRLVVQRLLFERHKKPDGDPPASEPSQEGPAKRPAAGQAGPTPPSAETAEPWGAVTIEGQASDNVAVATFVVSLRESGLFRRVELKSSVGKTSADGELRTYQLECDI